MSSCVLEKPKDTSSSLVIFWTMTLLSSLSGPNVIILASTDLRRSLVTRERVLF